VEAISGRGAAIAGNIVRRPRPDPPMALPRPVHVAHVIHRLDYGGLENGVVNLVNGLPHDAVRHSLVCLTTASDFRRRIRRPDVAVYELRKQPGQDPGAYLRLWRLLRQLAPDVVHTRNTGVMDCAVVAWAAGVPVRVHGCHGFDVDDLHGTRPRRRRLRRACDRFVDHYVTVSRQLADWLMTTDGVAPGRITQIYNGVDLGRFVLPVRTGGDFVVGTVGRLQAVKDQATLLRATARLLEREPGLRARLRLRLVGDGAERGPLERLARELGIAGSTTFTGFRDDIPAELARLDVFVLPSLNEGISNTVLEAMACATPVIATAVGGNPELVTEGETGFLVAVGDEQALAERLGRYAADPALRARHGQAGRARVERDFSIPRMLADYAAFYARVARPLAEAA
jgi:sugar transferase (PEP-CTERM/EpsH1 system associated)